MSYSHEWGMQQHIFPRLLGTWAGSKGQILLNVNYKANFKDFQTKLCVFSQIKGLKHIKRDFHSVAWVMPQGWDWGVPGGQKLNFLNLVISN